MGNDRLPESQLNVLKRHILRCSKAGNFDVETAIRPKFKHSRYYTSSTYLYFIKII